LDPVIHFYQQVEIVCHALLVFSGIGTVLYSVSVSSVEADTRGTIALSESGA
jgi:hypothetical protein